MNLVYESKNIEEEKFKKKFKAISFASEFGYAVKRVCGQEVIHLHESEATH